MYMLVDKLLPKFVDLLLLKVYKLTCKLVRKYLYKFVDLATCQMFVDL